jgi:hypothetical protein
MLRHGSFAPGSSFAPGGSRFDLGYGSTCHVGARIRVVARMWREAERGSRTRMVPASESWQRHCSSPHEIRDSNIGVHMVLRYRRYPDVSNSDMGSYGTAIPEISGGPSGILTT